MDKFKDTKIADKAAPCDGTRLYGVFDRRIRALIDGLFLRVDMTAVVDFFRYKLNRFAAGEFFDFFNRNPIKIAFNAVLKRRCRRRKFNGRPAVLSGQQGVNSGKVLAQEHG